MKKYTCKISSVVKYIWKIFCMMSVLLFWGFWMYGCWESAPLVAMIFPVDSSWMVAKSLGYWVFQLIVVGWWPRAWDDHMWCRKTSKPRLLTVAEQANHLVSSLYVVLQKSSWNYFFKISSNEWLDGFLWWIIYIWSDGWDSSRTESREIFSRISINLYNHHQIRC